MSVRPFISIASCQAMISGAAFALASRPSGPESSMIGSIIDKYRSVAGAVAVNRLLHEFPLSLRVSPLFGGHGRPLVALELNQGAKCRKSSELLRGQIGLPHLLPRRPLLSPRPPQNRA